MRIDQSFCSDEDADDSFVSILITLLMVLSLCLWIIVTAVVWRFTISLHIYFIFSI